MDTGAILIEKLEIAARVGITERERAWPQPLTAHLSLWPTTPFPAIQDVIENTVDYAEVCEAVKKIAASRQRNLIETLAEEIAAGLLERFSLAAVELELRKYVLPETAYVAVKIRRPSSA